VAETERLVIDHVGHFGDGVAASRHQYVYVPYALAGETSKALDILDRAVGTGQGFRAWMESDPDLDALRSSPRFQQILARLAR